MSLTQLKNPTVIYTMPNALPLGQTGLQTFVNTGQTGRQDRQTDKESRRDRQADAYIALGYTYSNGHAFSNVCYDIYILQRSCLFKYVLRYTYCNGHACPDVYYDRNHSFMSVLINSEPRTKHDFVVTLGQILSARECLVLFA